MGSKLSEFMLENVPRVLGHKCLDDDASRSRKDTVACSMHGGVVLLKHKKIVSDNLGMSGSGL